MTRLINPGNDKKSNTQEKEPTHFEDWRDQAQDFIKTNDNIWTKQLEKDETLLWFGQPSKPQSSYFPTWLELSPFVFSIFIFLLGIFLIYIWYALKIDDLILPLFSGTLIVFGGYLTRITKSELRNSRQNFKISYALTDKRALIRTNNFLQSVPLDKNSVFNVTHNGKYSTFEFEGRDQTATHVHFINGVEIVPRPNFHNLIDAKDVFQHLKQITK